MTRYASAEAGALRLLIVEDDGLIAMDLEGLLEDMGHRVVAVASNVERALSLIGKLHQELDGAIVDANLGGTSAVPVTAALSDHSVPYMLASGYGPSELRRLGFDAVSIRKPYRTQSLDTALVQLSFYRDDRSSAS
jgi:CheY-like chemotaxis protein